MENSMESAKMKIGLCKRKYSIYSVLKYFTFTFRIAVFSHLFHFGGLNQLAKKVNIETVFSIEQKFLFLANFNSFLYLIFYHLAKSIYNQCSCKIQTYQKKLSYNIKSQSSLADEFRALILLFDPEKEVSASCLSFFFCPLIFR